MKKIILICMLLTCILTGCAKENDSIVKTNANANFDEIGTHEWISPDGVHYWVVINYQQYGIAPRYDNHGKLVIDKY